MNYGDSQSQHDPLLIARSSSADIHRDSRLAGCTQTRRDFLAHTGYTVALAAIPGVSFPAKGVRRDHPKKKIFTLSQLEDNEPLYFRYPRDDIQCSHFIVKLGEPAGGGVGDNQDVVAYSVFCPHMGGVLAGAYDDKYKVSGPCPLHLTTFDLTRHGMVISGHATQSLPQVVLETEGDSIYATGIQGLIYGLCRNPT